MVVVVVVVFRGGWRRRARHSTGNALCVSPTTQHRVARAASSRVDLSQLILWPQLRFYEAKVKHSPIHLSGYLLSTRREEREEITY